MMVGLRGALSGRSSTRENCPDIIQSVNTETSRHEHRETRKLELDVFTCLLVYLCTLLIFPMTTLSPSAQKIQDLLNSLGYNYTVIEHAESTRTAQEAADRAGCELGQIVKSLIFKGKGSNKPILVLTSGANRVDEKRISEYTGETIGKADADFARAVTGFAIGGVPPIGHIEKIETYLDEDFLQYENVWAAAGTPNAIFELKTDDLQKMTDGKVARVK